MQHFVPKRTNCFLNANFTQTAPVSTDIIIWPM